MTLILHTFLSQTFSPVNDICEYFLHQANIDDYRQCDANDLCKIIIKYSTMEAKLLKVLHFKIIPFKINWLYMQLFCTQIKTIIEHWNIYFCLMQEQFKLILTACDITFEYYIQKLTEGSTNGMELSILTLHEIFGISVMVLCKNHLWKSDDLLLDKFHMYFIMFKTRQFMSASKRSVRSFCCKCRTHCNNF